MKYILIILFISFPFVGISQLIGRVISITDGDTFVLLDENNNQIKVRLHGIDCPELQQDFGQVAKKFLGQMIFQKNVNVNDNGLDRYGRTIGIVYCGRININEEMLIGGMAWHYKKYDSNPMWAKLEEFSRDKRKGLWSQSKPVPPWEWRKSKRK